MRILEGLQPERVFYYFEEIAKIPHPSFQEKAISDYLVSFAKEHGLEYYQDEIYNVIMIKEASAGYENEEPVILQGHMDMVAEKESDCAKDMEKEGLDLYIEGDFVKARGTTLGGDDGIAVAMALSLLEDDALQHPRLEFVCTVYEEVGLLGANAIDTSPLKGRRLLNIDSEGEGEVLASCAGGGRVEISLPIVREDLEGRDTFEVVVSGLMGGHSGAEIDKGRCNANILMAHILCAIIKEVKFRLIEFDGGTKDNVIPRESRAVLAIRKEYSPLLLEIMEQATQHIEPVFSVSDPDISITINKCESQGRPVLRGMTKKIIALMLSLPNGVVRMSDHMPGLVETSLNLGILHMDDKAFHMTYAPRSSSSSAYYVLREKLRFLGENAGAKVEVLAEYPAWEYKEQSPFRDKLCRVYKELFDKDLKVTSIHAGVECGLFAEKIADMDAVSMGPDIFDIHTPAERLSIASTERTYRFVRALIEKKG